jgi:hypothetical protein
MRVLEEFAAFLDLNDEATCGLTSRNGVASDCGRSLASFRAMSRRNLRDSSNARGTLARGVIATGSTGCPSGWVYHQGHSRSLGPAFGNVTRDETARPDARQTVRVDLTKTFDRAAYEGALESWSWLDLAGKTPVFTSLFGDVVLESGDGYWFLDTVKGKLTRAWSNQDDLRTAFADPEVREQYLLEGLAMAAAQHGIALAREQIYDFSTPPVLGGDLAVENLSAADFQVAVNIAGQIHEQVRDLPPGTPIGQAKISPPE